MSLFKRILEAVQKTESINDMQSDIAKLSHDVGELAKALSALANVVREHNIAIKINSEENEYIAMLLHEAETTTSTKSITASIFTHSTGSNNGNKPN